MKKSILPSFAMVTATVALAVAAVPSTSAAEDEKSPGKASDTIKEPATTAPASGSRATTGTTTPGKAPGKESDTVHESKAATRFAGHITEINREAKTIVIEDESRHAQKLHIGTESKLMKGSEKATWENLKKGAQVRGTISGSGEQLHVVTLDLQE